MGEPDKQRRGGGKNSRLRAVDRVERLELKDSHGQRSHHRPTESPDWN
jgi:hypothetical protein